LRALEKNPDQRFQDAKAYSTALSDFAKTLGKVDSPTPATREREVELFNLYQPSVLVQKERHQAQMSAQEKAEDRLLVMMRDQTSKTIPLTREGLTIGRGEDNDLVVDQPNVSRHHARIEHDGQRYVVVDLNSTNGVYLNDVKVLPQVREPFNPESVLTIGDTWLKLERGRTQMPGGRSFGIAASFQEARSLASEAESVSGQIAMRIESTQLAIQPGESAPVSITILNQGGLVDHFRVSVEGVPASWVQKLPEPVHLMPGKQTTVGFTIAPPRSSESAAKSHPITIRVSSTARPEQVAELAMTLTLGTYQSFAADMRPGRQSGIREAKFTVRLQNRGNAPLQVALEAEDQEDNCIFSFDPPIASVQAGQEDTVVMNVQSNIPLFDDSTRFHQIAVTVRPVQAPEMVRTLHAVWEQRMPAFDLALEPASQSSLSATVFEIAAQNKTSDPLDLELEVRHTSPQVDFALEPRSLSLLPGQDGRARLSVNARSPLQGTSAETHAFSVVARPSAAPTKTEEVTGEWHRIPPQFKITLQTHQKSSMSEGHYTILVTNQIQELLNIQLELNDAEGKCSFQLDPARVSLAPGETRDVRLTVRSKSPLPGDADIYHSFTVRARSAEGPAVVQQVQGEWVQAPPSFTAEIHPQEYSSRMKATYSLLIRNQSDSDLDFKTSAAAKDNALEFSMEPQNPRVGAGKSVSTNVNVRAVRRLKGKDFLDHRFSVSARPTQAPGVSRQVEANWRQLAGGRSAGAFAFLGLIAWIIVIAGWVFAWAYWPEFFFSGFSSLNGEFDTGILFDPGPFLTATIGLIGGLATGIAIRFTEPGFSKKKIVLSALAWALALGIGLGLVPQYLDMGPLLLLIASAVGGFLTTVLVRATGLPLSGSSALLIVGGWVLASVPLTMEFGVIAPFLFGGIGGIVMFWQIGRARAQLE
ncbi:MAG: FHA domain-containing protein, partial [Chloroflexota bacterium]